MAANGRELFRLKLNLKPVKFHNVKNELIFLHFLRFIMCSNKSQDFCLEINNMKNRNLIVLVKVIFTIIICLFGGLNVVAQKPKSTPKPKTTSQTKPVEKIKPAELERNAVFSKQSNLNISAQDKTKAEEYFKKGQALWKEFEIRQTIEAYTKALELYPNYLPALSERGIVYFMISEYQNAVADFDKVLNVEPENVRILHFRGLALTDIAVKTKDDDNDRKTANSFAQKSLADLSKAIELDPNDFAYYNARGKLLSNFSFYKEAIVDFEKSISIKPNEVAYTQLGLAKYYLDDKNAIDEINKAIKIAPTFAEAYYVRGTINRDEGRYKEAILDFDEALKNNKYSAKYYNTRGMLYFRLQDGYMAVADFTAAIKEKNDFATAYYNRAFTYKKYPYSVSTDSDDNAIDKIRLQRKKMLEDLDSAIKFNPKFDAAYVERGLINSTDMRNKSTPDAETIARLNLAFADFEQAIKYNPKNAEAYNGRASVYDDLGKKELALADYSKAIELDPTIATAYMGRMAIYCEMGKKELSVADEKKVKELGFAAINICS